MTARPEARDLRPGDVLVWTGTSERRSVDRAKVIAHRKADGSGWWMTDGSGLADVVWLGGAWTTLDALVDSLDAAEARLAAVRALCDAAEANPEGWGGPMVVSFSRTVQRAVNGGTP